MAKQKKNTKDSPVKKTSSQSKIEEAITHVLESLNSIEERLDILEEASHEPMVFVDDVDALDSRLSKVEGRMGL